MIYAQVIKKVGEAIESNNLICYSTYFPADWNASKDAAIMNFYTPTIGNTFDEKEIIKITTLEITLRSNSLDRALSYFDSIKESIYDLKGDIDSKIQYINLIGEQQPVYRDELKCYETYLDFNLK